MHNQKKYYYVGVIDDRYGKSTLKLVYKLDYDNKMAYWGTFEEMKKKGVKPIKMQRGTAEQYATLLRWNCTDAFVMMVNQELEVL